MPRLSSGRKNEAAAQQLEELVDQLIKLARQNMLAETAKQAASSDPVEQAMAKYSQRVSGRLFEAFRPCAKAVPFRSRPRAV